MNTFDVVVRMNFVGNPDDDLVREMATNILRNSGKMIQDHGADAYVAFVGRQSKEAA